MRRLTAVLGAALFLMPIAAYASASPQSIAVLSSEAAWVKAAASGDAVALGKILDDDFVHVNYKGGVEYRADELARVKKGIKYTQATSEQTVKFVGGVAIVNGVNTVSQGGKVLVRLRYTDTYHKVGNVWRAVWAQETAISK